MAGKIDDHGDSYNYNPVNMSGVSVNNPFAVPVAPGVKMPPQIQFAAPPSLGKVEYLYDEGEKQQRGVFGRMVAGGGIGYLCGHGVGGVYGTTEGVKLMESSQPTRIKLTTLVNSLTKRGPEWANRFGVIGLAYGATTHTLVQVRGTNDAVNTCIAGVVAPAMVYAHRGIRPTIAAAGTGAVFAAVGTVAWAMWNGHADPVSTLTDAWSGFKSGESHSDY